MVKILPIGTLLIKNNVTKTRSVPNGKKVTKKNVPTGEKEEKAMKILKKIILIIIIGMVAYTGYGIYEEAQIKDGPSNSSSFNEIIQEIGENKNSNEPNITKTQVTTSLDKSEKDLNLVAKEYKGYKVSSKLTIEKLEIDTYVLENYSKNAMEVCVVKYYGPNPNEVGNYCIAGHNYITKNMFSKLGKLELGDKLTLTDNYYGKIEYEVYDKYKAEPNQVEALEQNTDGRREITLITCSDYSQKRIIIKAREKMPT